MSWRSFLIVCFILLGAIVVAGCGGGAAAPENVPDTAVPAESPTEAPTQAPAEAPTEAPPEAPTEVPTDTPVPEPKESIRFKWDPSGNLPADSDDVDDIVGEIRRSQEGITGGFGNEVGITVLYNPTLITVEEIMETLGSIGHPVEAEN